MTGRADPLAVLDEFAELVGDDHDVGLCNCDITGARVRVAALVDAGQRTTAAFRALGEVTPRTREADRARHECEVAMLALDAALAPFKE